MYKERSVESHPSGDCAFHTSSALMFTPKWRSMVTGSAHLIMWQRWQWKLTNDGYWLGLGGILNTTYLNKHSCVSTVWLWKVIYPPPHPRLHRAPDLKVSPLTRAFPIFHSTMKLVLFKREMGIYASLDIALYPYLPSPIPVLFFPCVYCLCVFH